MVATLSIAPLVPRTTSDGELSAFGLRIEDARKRRGMSKGGLAQQLGVSRSTLWRLLTGKSEASLPDLQKFSRVLLVEIAFLTGDSDGSDELDSTNAVREEAPSYAGQQLEEFVSNIDRVVRMLSTGEGAKMGPKSKLAIMNGIEEAARLAGQPLPKEFYEIRRRINEGKL
jgi:transcriptional regulator with XRE-family HTH domain